MKLILTRHGETDWNVMKHIQGSTDTELNETGIAQAKQLGNKILQNNLHISRIYTSKQKRARKTAEIIASILGVECINWDGLEEMNLGLWEGHTWDEVATKFPDEYNEWSVKRRYTRTPEGESYQDLLDRLVPALKCIAENESGQRGNALVVTHSADIMTLLSFINDTSFAKMHENYTIGNAETVELEDSVIYNCSL